MFYTDSSEQLVLLSETLELYIYMYEIYIYLKMENPPLWCYLSCSVF